MKRNWSWCLPSEVRIVSRHLRADRSSIFNNPASSWCTTSSDFSQRLHRWHGYALNRRKSGFSSFCHHFSLYMPSSAICLFIFGLMAERCCAASVIVNRLSNHRDSEVALPSSISKEIPDFVIFDPSGSTHNEVDHHEKFTHDGQLEQLVVEADAVRAAILRFQQFAGLPMTGILDADTRKLMLAPRCGVPDFIYDGSDAERWSTSEREEPKFENDERATAESNYARGLAPSKYLNGRRRLLRAKRYAIQGSRWKTKNLVWKVAKYTDKLPKETVDQVFARALQIWANASQLTFRQATSDAADDDANINIKFVTGQHGDKEPFDGPGGILAHAFFPMFGGAAHFDDAEQWTDGTPRGTNLYQVAAHEFGHALGLSHSNIRSAIMAPFYRGYNDKTHLDEDDIGGIEYLYGENANVANRRNQKADYYDDYYGWDDGGDGEKVPVERPKSDEVCQRPLTVKIDAITRVADGNVYAFVGKFYYKMNSHGEFDLDDKYYPRRISTDWPGVSAAAPVDAALTWADGKTFIFQGDKYWRFHNRKAAPGYPKQISEGFQGIPDNVDAAFVWPGNGATYFTKGNQGLATISDFDDNSARTVFVAKGRALYSAGHKFWRYDSQRDDPVPNGYPRDLGTWNGGVARRIDSGFVWKNDQAYLFSGPNYYRMVQSDDDHAAETTLFSNVDNGYPRLTAAGWFGCKISKSDFLPATTLPPVPIPTTTERGVLLVIVNNDTLPTVSETTTTTKAPPSTTTTIEPTTTQTSSPTTTTTTTETVSVKTENQTKPTITTQVYEFIEPDRNVDSKIWFVYKTNNNDDGGNVFTINADRRRLTADDSWFYGNQKRVYFANAAVGALESHPSIAVLTTGYTLSIILRFLLRE